MITLNWPFARIAREIAGAASVSWLSQFSRAFIFAFTRIIDVCGLSAKAQIRHPNSLVADSGWSTGPPTML
jgi:hypothetical protein